MSDAKHTPGPWKIFDGVGASRFSPVIVDSIPDIDGKCVANCICHVAGTNKDREANAQLIAAAPYLLDACQEMLKEMMVWEDEHGIHPAAALARFAIAKAIGQKS